MIFQTHHNKQQNHFSYSGCVVSKFDGSQLLSFDAKNHRIPIIVQQQLATDEKENYKWLGKKLLISSLLEFVVWGWWKENEWNQVLIMIIIIN